MTTYWKERNGLPNFARRIRQRPVTVGFLGGSLSLMKAGWRPMFQEWLDGSHAATGPHRQLNAARGGVGSATGAFVMRQELCGRDPDLVFVEYAINDSFDFITPPSLRPAFIEGIVRGLWECHPECDICFVHMHHIRREPEIASVVADYEVLASHYGIPSIHVGRYLKDRVADGEWSFRGEGTAPALLRDECHPEEPGNRLVTGLITQAIGHFLAQPGVTRGDAPPPLHSDRLAGGRFLPLDPAMIRGPYRSVTGLVGNIEGEVTRHCLGTGSRLEIRGDFAVVGLAVVVGPSSGIIEITANGRTRTCTLFDEWCHYQRASSCILVETPGDLEPADRQVTVRLAETPPDYTVCPKLAGVPADRSLDVVGLYVVGGAHLSQPDPQPAS